MSKYEPLERCNLTGGPRLVSDDFSDREVMKSWSRSEREKRFREKPGQLEFGLDISEARKPVEPFVFRRKSKRQ